MTSTTYYVIYKANGHFKGTPESNFESYLMNERLISDFSDFETVEEIIDYCRHYFVRQNEGLIIDSSAL